MTSIFEAPYKDDPFYVEDDGQPMNDWGYADVTRRRRQEWWMRGPRRLVARLFAPRRHHRRRRRKTRHENNPRERRCMISQGRCSRLVVVKGILVSVVLYYGFLRRLLSPVWRIPYNAIRPQASPIQDSPLHDGRHASVTRPLTFFAVDAPRMRVLLPPSDDDDDMRVYGYHPDSSSYYVTAGASCAKGAAASAKANAVDVDTVDADTVTLADLRGRNTALLVCRHQTVVVACYHVFTASLWPMIRDHDREEESLAVVALDVRSAATAASTRRLLITRAQSTPPILLVAWKDSLEATTVAWTTTMTPRRVQSVVPRLGGKCPSRAAKHEEDAAFIPLLSHPLYPVAMGRLEQLPAVVITCNSDGRVTGRVRVVP